MPTQTINASGGTVLSYNYPMTDYSSESYLKTTCFFIRNKDNPAIQRQFDGSCALLRFVKPDILNYKKITHVTASIAIRRNGGDPAPLSPTVYDQQEFYIGPYKSDESLSLIHYSNYEELGELGNFVGGGEPGKSERFPYIPGTRDFYATFDVTTMFTSNIMNGIFNLGVAYGQAVSSAYSVIKNSCTLLITYEDVVQSAPTPLFPKNTTIFEAPSMMFSWQFNSETEAVQAGVQLEYKKSTDQSYTVLSLTTTAHSATITANFSPGTYQWRLKATNNIDETSDYSEVVTFSIIGKPAAPVIATPPNKALTTISWSAANQYACEIKLLDANQKELIHETLASAQTTYSPNIFLKGNYVFLVRVKNESDLWSDWAQIAFAITVAGPAAATVTAIPENEHAKIEFAIPEGAGAALIRYDDKGEMKILAGNLQTGIYIDNTICPDREYAYTVRTYVNGYTDSTLKRITVHYSGAYLKSESDSLHLDLSEEQFLPHSEDIAREIAIMNFSGRELPMVERGEFTTNTVTKRCYLPIEDKATMDRMAKAKSVYYRDSRGNAFKAAITQVSYTEYMNDGYIANITMIKTAEDEVIVNV